MHNSTLGEFEVSRRLSGGMRHTISIVGEQVPQLRRGKVWCTVCGREQAVDSRECMANGWPKCCGYTMTIDSPEERQKLATTQS